MYHASLGLKYLLLINIVISIAIIAIPIVFLGMDTPAYGVTDRDFNGKFKDRHTKHKGGVKEELNAHPDVFIELNYDAKTGRLYGAERIVCNGDIKGPLPIWIDGRKEVIDEERCREGYLYKIDRKVSKLADPYDNIALMGDWLPVPHALSYYRLEVTVPSMFKAISEADEVVVIDKDHGEKPYGNAGKIRKFIFNFPYLRRGISLIIGDYVLKETFNNGVSISAYVFKGHDSLAMRYIERAADFIGMLSKRLGRRYPFRRFSIVENARPTGVGLASMTLIGRQIISYPFVAEQSLGHEIAHSWFGNGVYVKGDTGNWCEGITTYAADHLFKEKAGKGASYRHDTLIDYQSYVNKGNAFALRDFSCRHDRPSKAIGYGKAMMLFHMLRKRLGDEVFYKGLGEFIDAFLFADAGWDDIRGSFERVSGQDLTEFFNEWLTRSDVPDLSIEDASFKQGSDGDYIVKFFIVQHTETPYRGLYVKAMVKTPSSRIETVEKISHRRTLVTVRTAARPSWVALDPEFDIMRRLHKGEFPPAISRLIGARNGYIYWNGAATDEKDKKISSLIPLDENSISYEKIKGSSILFVNKAPQRLYEIAISHGKISEINKMRDMIRKKASNGSGMPFLLIVDNPFNNDEVFGFLSASDDNLVYRILLKASHYGRYAFLRFDRTAERVTEKEKIDAEQGIKAVFSRPIWGVSSKDLYGIDRIIDELAERRATRSGLQEAGVDSAGEGVFGVDVIFVGEQHDRFSHHISQLEVIRTLYERGIRFSVGMEMFQRQFQPVIDDFLANRITEKEMLRKTEYFRRWGYDYGLYRPIIRFCKANGISIRALNAPKEITSKVARSCIDALTDDERRLIPEELDLGNLSYKRQLKEIFKAHRNRAGDKISGNFECFYQAQIIWDETMAETIVNYIIGEDTVMGREEATGDYNAYKAFNRQNRQIMVVLAGNGHLSFGYGIPDRVRRRSSGRLNTAILLNTDEAADPRMGDYFLFPPDVSPPFTARLGVYLGDSGPNKGLIIKRVMEASPTDRAGLRVNDEIIAIDGERVSDIYDLKLNLAFKREGDNATLTIKRRRRFLPDITRDITVTFWPEGMEMKMLKNMIEASQKGRAANAPFSHKK